MAVWQDRRARRRQRPTSVPAPDSDAVATCRAPFVSMRLAPNGDVQACCVNESHPLGSVTSESLLDIWRGERFGRLRDAMNRADWSLGCDTCGSMVDDGLRARSLAADYDHFPAAAPDLAWPRHIEFALSITCNLQCVQCSGEFSSAIRTQREGRPPLVSPYGDRFFEELRPFLPHLQESSFIGGEPFLMRESRRVWDLMLELDERPQVWTTTNGTFWDDRVEHYLHALRMGISLSIDGVEPSTIASIRVGADPEALLANRDRFLAAARSYGGTVKLNYCVMPGNWAEFLPFLQEADRLDAPVFAARVLKPAEHSLHHLPTGELAEVLSAMEAQAGSDGGGLARNRPVWDGVLADLRAELAHRRADRSAGTPVGLSPRPAVGGPPDPEAVEGLVADITRADGRAPARVEIRDGRVRAVEVPDWAEFLGLADCVGLDEQALLPAIESQIGGSVTPVSTEVDGGVVRSVHRVEGPNGPAELRAVLRTGYERTDVLISLS